MKIDVTTVLKLRTGEPLEQYTPDAQLKEQKFKMGLIKLNEAEFDALEKEPITFKTSVVSALDAMTDADKGLAGDVKRLRGKLADRIYAANGEADFTIEELKMIKDRVGEVCSTYVLNVIYDILGE